jgi:hypothetical protein
MTGTITKNDEAERLIEGISHAIKSSPLLSLMRHSRNNNNNNNNNNNSINNNNNSASTSTSSCGISDISLSTLNHHILPIREALERIDPQRLLDLKLISASSSTTATTSSSLSSSSSQSQSQSGPRIKDG